MSIVVQRLVDEKAAKTGGRPSSAAAAREAATGPGSAARGDARPPMKPSGIPWIGDIPVEWSVLYLFQLAEQVKNRNLDLAEKNLLSLSYGKIKRKNIDSPDGLLPASFDGYNIIERGDVVLRLTDLQNDQTSLRVGQALERGIITSAYTTVRPRIPETARYLFYALDAFDLAKGFYGMGSGVRQGLNWPEVKQLELPLPPLPEQRAIAAFLDEKCATIDAIVEEAKAGIAEYAEWKRSIIFHAVTKGIPEKAPQPGGRPSPAAAARGDATGPGRAAVLGRRAARVDARPPRDSGEKWIGQIPAHWKIARIKNAFSVISGSGFKPEIQGRTEGDYPVCKASDIARAGKNCSAAANWICESERKEHRFSIIPQGSILHAKIGEAMKKNARTIARIDCCADNNCQGLAPHGIDVDYGYYLLCSIDMDWFSNAGTIPSINNAQLLACHIPFPPLPAQRAIAAWLDEKCAAIDALVEEKKKLIEDLGAYKKSLIYETVTGKRRVVK